MLKLPKSLQAHPHLQALETHLSQNLVALREGGPPLTAQLTFDDNFRKALHIAHGTGHVAQGLEFLAQTLDKEQKGLRLVQERTGQPPAHRASRLLIITNDGSERFYRDAERLLILHSDRVLGVRLDASGEELGAAFSSKGKAVKALMIDDRVALGLFLSAYADRLC